MLLNKPFLKKAEEIIKRDPEMFEALMEFERTGKLPRLSYKKRVNFTVDGAVFNRFRGYCLKKGYSMSSLIEKFMSDKLGKG